MSCLGDLTPNAAMRGIVPGCPVTRAGVLKSAAQPLPDGRTGRAVLQFASDAHISARGGREVRPDEME